MDFLNPSPVAILPTTMWVTHRALESTPELTAGALLDVVCPPALVEDKVRGGEHVRRAIQGLKQLGMIVENTDGATLRVSHKHANVASFAQHLRQAVMIPPQELMIRGFAPAATDNQSDLLAPDVARGLEWFSEQPPLVGQSWSTVEDSKVFVNDTRWNVFGFWAGFLGFSKPSILSDGIVSDPTVAVLDAITNPLGSPLRPTEALDIKVFLAHLDRELPVLGISKSIGDGGRLAAPTAFALEAITARGVIQMERKADAKNVVGFMEPSGATEGRFVSHVTIRGGN